MSYIYQERFWRELDQLKIHVYYLENYLEETIRYDRNVNAFLAVMSNGSIASWIIWQHLQFLWAGLIALSQFINAIKSFLPYSKRLKALFGMTNELESLFLSMESNWFGISEGRLTEEEIHNLHMKIKEQRRQIIQKHLGSQALPENQKLLDKAKESAKLYFNQFYMFSENSHE